MPVNVSLAIIAAVSYTHLDVYKRQAFYRDAKAEFEQLLNGLRRGGGPGLLG